MPFFGSQDPRVWHGPRLAAVALVLALLAAPAAAQTKVVDGDTIKLNGMTVDLWGIDAPEIKQICKTGYLAGVVAAVALTELTREKTVTCEFRGIVGGDGHVLGLCRANGNDLSKAMVKIGMAWAHTGHSQEYVALEAQARRERIGVHARACEPPWQYRSRVLGYDARVAPEPSGRSGSQ